VLAPVIAPYALDVPSGPSYAPPSLDHPVGTNNLGQDMLSRLIWGARASLTVAVGAATLALAIGGGGVGMVAGLVGGSSTRWRCAS
jgi:ABC-type dipeptide/oligopeptide/nickel transport system permease subunit